MGTGEYEPKSFVLTGGDMLVFIRKINIVLTVTTPFNLLRNHAIFVHLENFRF